PCTSWNCTSRRMKMPITTTAATISAPRRRARLLRSMGRYLLYGSRMKKTRRGSFGQGKTPVHAPRGPEAEGRKGGGEYSDGQHHLKIAPRRAGIAGHGVKEQKVHAGDQQGAHAAHQHEVHGVETEIKFHQDGGAEADEEQFQRQQAAGTA